MKQVTLRRGLAALLTAALSFGAVTQANADTLRIGFQKYGSLTLLKASGSLEQRLADQGIAVRWIEFPAGPQLLEGLNVGAVDFGTAGETPPVFAQAAGADLLYVAHEPPAPTGEAIVVPKDSPISSVADLRGKRVALNKGSNVHYLLVRALEKAGLGIADITPVYLPPADGRAAFERGAVDAWVIWDPFLAAAEQQLKLRTLADGTGLVSNHQFYLASRSYAEANPQIIHILTEELDRVGQWAVNNVDEATALVAPLIGLEHAITRTAIERKSHGTRPLSDDVIAQQQHIADTFHRLKLIPRQLNIRQVIWTPPSQAAANFRR